MLIVKAHALAFGYSGISHETLDRIIWHINEDVIPLVPSQGSVGASGDLAPLAHLFLPLIGLGKVHTSGGVMDTAEWMAQANVAPIQAKSQRRAGPDQWYAIYRCPCHSTGRQDGKLPGSCRPYRSHDDRWIIRLRQTL